MNAQLRTRAKNMTAADLLADIERWQRDGSNAADLTSYAAPDDRKDNDDD